ncbi:MAG: FYDLN acid domain-containing protein [Candidatus Coatesbacteria bacterium]|nr:FYDLN acid domain-containing protein [Candidatus Coatesbacteria bacterium]
MEGKKICPECGNKLNYNPSDKTYICPFCGEEFTERKGRLVKGSEPAAEPDSPLSEEEMRKEMEDEFGDTLLGAQLADEEKRKERRVDEASLFELRLKLNEAKLMVKVAYTRGLGLCLFLDAVVLILTANYDVLIYGIIAAFVITVGTILYLNSYSTKIEKWRLNLETRVKELEKDLYLEELDETLDSDEEPELPS